jgi:hypothetical protein
VEIEGSWCAVARQRDVVEGPRVTLLEMSRNGGAFRQRNRLTAVIVINAHSACWRQLGNVTDGNTNDALNGWSE